MHYSVASSTCCGVSNPCQGDKFNTRVLGRSRRSGRKIDPAGLINP
jgi:hypothetical protein